MAAGPRLLFCTFSSVTPIFFSALYYLILNYIRWIHVYFYVLPLLAFFVVTNVTTKLLPPKSSTKLPWRVKHCLIGVAIFQMSVEKVEVWAKQNVSNSTLLSYFEEAYRRSKCSCIPEALKGWWRTLPTYRGLSNP